MWDAIGSIIGGALGFYGQQSANRSNERIGRENNVFSAREAQKNRDYQAYMSNTAWQRGISDMKSAGVNPMLAVSQGGASSPSGNSAQGIANANQQNEMQGMQNSIRDALTLKAQIKNTEANTRLADANAAKSVVEAKATASGQPERDTKADLWTDVNSAYKALRDGYNYLTKNASAYGSYLGNKAADIQGYGKRPEPTKLKRQPSEAFKNRYYKPLLHRNS
ncbi:MAG: DNA pilot protein [Arizlama microvirus]|nr:MAG: DNA pilot protein [Arizlama microvirus]